MLGALGVFGIIIHNLVKLNSLNRKAKGSLDFGQYFRLEIFSILLSVCVVAVALIAQHEIKQLEQVGKWLGLSFVTIGYMAQSIVVTIMGKAESYLHKEDEQNEGK